ncbi:unnamed protein product [Spodoptera littoralis]|uniref:Uncharacterized protein n=1 Tax=Spodoptera littoralis TaxID=7109 RepID=A0A9P0IAV7_SPOLI|nr:unnamed protein product [Spodoptera littoralis]CAH1642565.1 unnamed protein product [Spodoptera littoralis]
MKHKASVVSRRFFCEAVVSLRSSRLIRAEAWLSHTYTRDYGF